MRIVSEAELRPAIAAIFEAAGSAPEEARIVGDHLVDANLVGHESHGVIRVAKYLGWLAEGGVTPDRHARVVVDTGPLVAVEGDGGYGQVIAAEAMAIGLERVRTHGMAAVALRDAGHVGRIGAWAEMAADAGILSLHFVNTSGFGILVAPFGGSDRRLSANPIGAGIPVPGRPPVILDIATSIVAEGKIQVARNKGANLPEGAMLDGAGRPTRDPEAFYADPPGAILPFGGHKGSGLSFVTEVLAGSLTGGGSSHPDHPTAHRLVNSMMTVLFDPAVFSDPKTYAEDVGRLVDWVTASPPAEPGGTVLLPGDPERALRAERRAKGIPLDPVTIDQILAAAASVGASDRAELACLSTGDAA
ncbi:MAG: malate/lactate/ureidoglycolate dehydrogenase [Azospirillaceae bacterium]